MLEFTPQTGLPVAASALPTLVKEARGLGFSRLGVASADAQEHTRDRLSTWLDTGYHGAMQYMQRPRLSPAELLPGARSVLVGVMSYGPGGLDPHAVAAYARGQDYHGVVKLALMGLGQACADVLGQPVRARACVDSVPMLERAWALRAGVAFIGKSTLAITPGVGTATFLGELIVDVDLPASEPIAAGCGTCRQCLDACPTAAFVDAYVLDARRCISYLTIEYRGWIPLELRPLMGAHVFGCDICQRVCPFNASSKLPAPPAELEPKAARSDVDLMALLEMTSGDYRRLVAGSAMRRASRQQLQRNAAVALGNVGGQDSVSALIRALTHSTYALVRGHAAWALGRIGGTEARAALAAAELRELDPEVQRELRLAVA